MYISMLIVPAVHKLGKELHVMLLCHIELYKLNIPYYILQLIS
jgi:hypothetical protein